MRTVEALEVERELTLITLLVPYDDDRDEMASGMPNCNR